MSRYPNTLLALVAFGIATSLPICHAQETRVTQEKRINVRADSEGGIVREIFVRSRDEDEPQVFFIQNGDEIQPGVIKLRSLIHEGAFLGVRMIELSPDLRLHYGVSGERGVMVSQVIESSPAAIAGLLVGDILLAADGIDLDSTQTVQEQIRTKAAGETLELTIQRNGQIQTLSASLVDSAEHAEPKALFELHVGAGEEGPEYRFGWHCADVGCPRLEDETLLDESMVRLRELLESGELGDRLPSQDPELQERIESLERRLHEIEIEIEQESAPD